MLKILWMLCLAKTLRTFEYYVKEKIDFRKFKVSFAKLKLSMQSV